MTHRNAPLSPEGRLRLVQRCQNRPIAHVAEALRRAEKWSASRIAFELHAEGISLSRRTVSRHLLALGLSRRRFIEPSGDTNRKPRKITARRPGHMVHIDVKKAGRIPDGGGWRVHGRGSPQNYHRPHGAAGGQPSAWRLRAGVTNVLASYN
ncbi:hypothetical protein GUY61_11035 [Streptomyces sp. GC420]|nr:hypothetical protein [Streptomyces sp. GC420]